MLYDLNLCKLDFLYGVVSCSLLLLLLLLVCKFEIVKFERKQKQYVCSVLKIQNFEILETIS